VLDATRGPGVHVIVLAKTACLSDVVAGLFRHGVSSPEIHEQCMRMETPIAVIRPNRHVLRNARHGMCFAGHFDCF
jgi:hypothetical protein